MIWLKTINTFGMLTLALIGIFGHMLQIDLFKEYSVIISFILTFILFKMKLMNNSKLTLNSRNKKYQSIVNFFENRFIMILQGIMIYSFIALNFIYF